MVPAPSATLQPAIKKGAFWFLFTFKNDMIFKIIWIDELTYYARRSNQLTILLSPVMLDSSIASEWPEIKTPSAGTWKNTKALALWS